MEENKVVLVGRPNVGKSSIINALVKRRATIVDDTPGITRDINYFEITHGDYSFKLADTGGLHLDHENDPFQEKIEEHILREIKDANVVLFVVDAMNGYSPLDVDLARKLREAGVTDKVIVIANKCDHEKVEYENFYQLGFDILLPLSSAHRAGIGDMLDTVCERLPKVKLKHAGEETIRVAIVGRPNAGKSSLLNTLINKDRALVSEIQGTTRDPINEKIKYNNMVIEFIDTAGFRKRTKEDVEYYSVNRAYQTIDHSDIVILLFDPNEFATDIESRLARYVEKVKKGIIFAINKTDLIKGEKKLYEDKLRAKLYYLSFAPIVFVSAIDKHGVGKLLTTIENIHKNYQQVISTSYVNKIVERIYNNANPPASKGKRLKIYFAAQVKSAPPYFVFSVNYPKLLNDSYERYLEKSLRKEFNFEGVPLKFRFKEH